MEHLYYREAKLNFIMTFVTLETAKCHGSRCGLTPNLAKPIRSNLPTNKEPRKFLHTGNNIVRVYATPPTIMVHPNDAILIRNLPRVSQAHSNLTAKPAQSNDLCWFIIHKHKTSFLGVKQSASLPGRSHHWQHPAVQPPPAGCLPAQNQQNCQHK